MVDQEPPLASFRSFVTLHLHLAARAMERFAEVYYKREFGMKLAECRVIGITASYGTASFRQICDDGAFEKSYASRLINTLHIQGLIDKTWSEVDQRTVYLSLTAAGRALHRRLHAAAAEINRQWLSAIPESERESMRRNLELLTASARNLDEQLREPGAPPDERMAASAS